jgi:hypothetical protein
LSHSDFQIESATFRSPAIVPNLPDYRRSAWKRRIIPHLFTAFGHTAVDIASCDALLIRFAATVSDFFDPDQFAKPRGSRFAGFPHGIERVMLRGADGPARPKVSQFMNGALVLAVSLDGPRRFNCFVIRNDLNGGDDGVACATGDVEPRVRVQLIFLRLVLDHWLIAAASLMLGTLGAKAGTFVESYCRVLRGVARCGILLRVSN